MRRVILDLFCYVFKMDDQLLLRTITFNENETDYASLVHMPTILLYYV